MARLTKSEKDTLRIARSVIRDLAHGWDARELQVVPQRICERLSALLGERYDFKTGEVQRDEKGNG